MYKSCFGAGTYTLCVAGIQGDQIRARVSTHSRARAAREAGILTRD